MIIQKQALDNQVDRCSKFRVNRCFSIELRNLSKFCKESEAVYNSNNELIISAGGIYLLKSGHANGGIDHETEI